MQLIHGAFLTGKVTVCESVLHAHADQNALQIIRLLHLEARKPHLDLSLSHLVWASPFHKFLIG